MSAAKRRHSSGASEVGSIHTKAVKTSQESWDNPVQLKEEEMIPEPIRTILSSLADPSISGTDCVSQMKEAFAVEENAPLIVYVDDIGNTILHVAAMGRKAEPISYIMSENPHLAEQRNADGHTPLEVLQSTLEEQRTWQIYVGDSFTGFCQSDIVCLAALTGTEIFDLTKVSDRAIWTVSSATEEIAIHNTQRLKYGCTCWHCIGGFLSPRMRLVLLFQAEMQHEILSDFLDGDCNDVLRYLPAAVRQSLTTNKSVRRGFINMCDHIAGCLRKKLLPNTATVLDFYEKEVSEWPPVTRNYLQRGGTVAAVAMMIFDRAIDADELAGDGSFMEAFEDDINQLPACRNDHEFDFVSGMCGYKRTSTV